MTFVAPVRPDQPELLTAKLTDTTISMKLHPGKQHSALPHSNRSVAIYFTSVCLLIIYILLGLSFYMILLYVIVIVIFNIIPMMQGNIRLSSMQYCHHVE